MGTNCLHPRGRGQCAARNTRRAAGRRIKIYYYYYYFLLLFRVMPRAVFKNFYSFDIICSLFFLFFFFFTPFESFVESLRVKKKYTSTYMKRKKKTTKNTCLRRRGLVARARVLLDNNNYTSEGHYHTRHK